MANNKATQARIYDKTLPANTHIIRENRSTSVDRSSIRYNLESLCSGTHPSQIYLSETEVLVLTSPWKSYSAKSKG